MGHPLHYPMTKVRIFVVTQFDDFRVWQFANLLFMHVYISLWTRGPLPLHWGIQQKMCLSDIFHSNTQFWKWVWWHVIAATYISARYWLWWRDLILSPTVLPGFLSPIPHVFPIQFKNCTSDVGLFSLILVHHYSSSFSSPCTPEAIRPPDLQYYMWKEEG